MLHISTEAVLKTVTILGAIAGIAISGYGVWLWVNTGFPINDLIPYKNSFAKNPIHVLYIGLAIFTGSVIHGFLKHGWFNSEP